MLDENRRNGVTQIIGGFGLDRIADAFAVNIRGFVDRDSDGFALLRALFLLVDGFQDSFVLGECHAKHGIHLV